MGINWSDITAFLTVIAIDVSLAGDNALIVGMVAAGLPPHLRQRAILMGIGAAAGLRVVFAVVAVRLMDIVGMAIAGGCLLLWVAWKLWREIRGEARLSAAGTGAAGGPPAGRGKTLRQAVTQILIADLSMSLDNVLAVAGAARDHIWVLVIGLALSVVLMAFAAALVARIIQRHRWIAYGGLGIVLYVALAMIWRGIGDAFGMPTMNVLGELIGTYFRH